MKILVAGSDCINQRFSERIIREGVHKLESVESGEEAIETAKTKSFDIMLLDLSLPGIEANELICRMKEISPGVGIITMTGSNSRTLEKKIREEGVIYYMIRPFDSNHLEDIINHI
ncbi:MAG: response regulator, partial [Deltaproteobacteria bacterium]|nr:response regulator [Deltaproteobacteria bacterium]